MKKFDVKIIIIETGEFTELTNVRISRTFDKACHLRVQDLNSLPSVNYDIVAVRSCIVIIFYYVRNPPTYM
jgi:hypothetical protein